MPCKINNKSDFDISEIENLIQDLYSFSEKRFGFDESPMLNLVSDSSNTSPLGKTAHYDPNNMEITIYVDGRHPKDIMRSFSHELVHHNQNLKGEFANIVGQGGSNYAQTNPHLRKMEKEAYLKGNMCFRDWEDGYKSSNPNILNERRIYKMSTKDWKNKELNTLLNERWGFSMDLSKLNENKKPDFPDVDGDGDRKEPISQAQKDKKEKDGDDKPKKKAKKGEIPPQLKQHVKGKQKDDKDSEESEEEVNESEDKKEKFKKGLKGELDDSADQKVDPKLKQKILDSLTISQLKAALAKKRKKMKKKIIEITTLKELVEMSSMGAGGIQGAPIMRKDDFYKGDDKREENIMRKELQTEMMMRQYIRNKIKKELWEQQSQEEKQEYQLRLVIRGLIKEAKEAANPHPNTGINKLRDAFRKAKPTLKAKYQQLTSSEEQRNAFSAHMLRAFVRLFDELDALQAKGDVEGEVTDIESAVGEAPDLGLEAPPKNQEADDIEDELEGLLEAILREVKVDIQDDDMDIVSDDEKEEKENNKSQVEKDFDKKKESDKEKEEFGAGLEGDATGRNQAFDTFRLVQTYFSDAYLDLSNEEDQKMYRDWCLYNMKLLFQNFEESLPTNPEEPNIENPEGA